MVLNGTVEETKTVTLVGGETKIVTFDVTKSEIGTYKVTIQGTTLTAEFTVVPEFPSFLIMPLLMISTLLAVIVYRRKEAIPKA